MAWLVAAIAALFFVTVDTWRQLHRLNALAAAGERARPAPPIDAQSPTGWQDGRRNSILQSADGYHWVIQTQQMIVDGTWRLRHVDYDNAPAGREVHWCSPLHWWLGAVAWADHLATGRPWVGSVESAALYAGPLLLGLFILLLVPWAARKFGAAAAALLAIGLVTIVPLAGEFGTGSFDHHGVAAVLALACELLLLAAWTGSPERARGALIASGIAGAAGLGVNAATLIPVLAAIGAGALAAHWIMRHDAARLAPQQWRAWGFAGAVASVGFYLLEYFPGHLGWRLEVNHPLYALAWAGAGDCLARTTRRMSGQAWTISPRDRLAALASSLALAAPLLVVLLAPAQTFVIADRFLWTLHVDYISEFSPLLASWPGWQGLLLRVTLLPAVGIAATWIFFRFTLAAKSKAALALALLPATALSVMALSQQRWTHVACALWLGTLVILAWVAAAEHFTWTVARRVIAGGLLGLLFLPYPIRAALDARRSTDGMSREEMRQFAVRDLAYWLRRRTGTDPVVVLSGPTATTGLVYHGGFRGVGTLYWENVAGLRALVDILGAPDAEQARALLTTRGVTHAVMLPWGSFADEATRLAHGVRAQDPVPERSFGHDLVAPDRALPDWVRPLPYRLPVADPFKDQVALVLEIAPAQTPADAAVARARFLAAMGNPAAARLVLTEILANNPNHIPAWVAMAQLDRAARDRAAHASTLQRLRPLLNDRPELEWSERVALAVELAAGNASTDAQGQLREVWTHADQREIRRLSPETLPLLLRATRDLAVEAPPKLVALAENIEASDRAAKPH